MWNPAVTLAKPHSYASRSHAPTAPVRSNPSSATRFGSQAPSTNLQPLIVKKDELQQTLLSLPKMRHNEGHYGVYQRVRDGSFLIYQFQNNGAGDHIFELRAEPFVQLADIQCKPGNVRHPQGVYTLGRSSGLAKDAIVLNGRQVSFNGTLVAFPGGSRPLQSAPIIVNPVTRWPQATMLPKRVEAKDLQATLLALPKNDRGSANQCYGVIQNEDGAFSVYGYPPDQSIAETFHYLEQPDMPFTVLYCYPDGTYMALLNRQNVQRNDTVAPQPYGSTSDIVICDLNGKTMSFGKTPVSFPQ